MQAAAKANISDNGIRPVVWWAVVGSLFLLLTVYIFGSWIFSPYFRPSPTGPDPIPPNLLSSIRWFELIYTLLALWVIVQYLIIPLIRERHVSSDGLMLLAFMTCWWTDPMVNYTNMCFGYNTYDINMGSWAAFIPGWSYPNAENMCDPLTMINWYIIYPLVTTVWGCWVLRKLGNMNMFLRLFILFLILGVFDVAMEQAICRTGYCFYPGVIGALTWWAGTVWQWPWYEIIFIPIFGMGYTLLRYYKDDKGLTFVERGIERVNISSGMKRVVRFLALVGFIQPMFIAYFIPFNLLALHVDTYPAMPSYVRNMMCGEGTEYACPNDEWVPIPHKGAKLAVRPDDPRLPKEIRDMQGISALGKDPLAE